MISRSIAAAAFIIVLAVGDLSAEEVPLIFQSTETGALTDPTDLFTNEEIEEGGSVVQPSIWYSTFSVDGGEVTLAILVDRWCGLAECPFRFRLEAEGGVVLHSHFGRAHGMICQDRSSMTVDPVELVLTACGNEIDLKKAW